MTCPLFPRLTAAAITTSRGSDLLDDATLAAADKIVRAVREEGEPALRRFAAEFDGLQADDPLTLGASDLRQALAQVDPADASVLQRTCDRITAFATAQLGCIAPLSTPIPGGRAGHTLEPIQRVGCYAPGGRYPLPSTVLMTVATARAAGCPSVCLATPSRDPILLAAAAVAGADAILLAGGAQGIAALAYGVALDAPVDIIVGPGNRWVTAAKHLVSRQTAIDMLAGPSELLVLADETADPALIAADLLAQAEHDVDARPFLVSSSADLADRVDAELSRQLATLPTRATAAKALRNGGAVITGSLEEALDICDRLAPEHLEVCTRRPAEVARQLRHAGAVFIGARAAEVFGDYGLGPNHSLPTNGIARSSAGLSVFTFLRLRTWMELDGPLDGRATQDVLRLAELEHLVAHRRAAEARCSPAGASRARGSVKR
ncbi:MAG: histidinol dehydrogenase [Phycisphaerales bacterium JB038]